MQELKGGRTVLHAAVVAGSVDLVKCILQHPFVDIEQTDYSRYTAYQLSWSHPEISDILLKKQAINLDFIEYILEDESSDESDSDEEYSHITNGEYCLGNIVSIVHGFFYEILMEQFLYCWADSSLSNFINVRSEVVV